VPIYEYACSKCSHTFEKLVRSMSSTEAIECPKCGSRQTERALSVFAVGAEGARSGASLPQGGCCPCGKNPGACGMG
jgi:putative FmdB family regulatory protein